jgi:two-component system, NarL family, response regulator DesR
LAINRSYPELEEPVIRVLLGHRGGLMRGALAAVLRREQDVEVVAELGTAADVLSVATRQRPHVVVLDPSLGNTISVDQLCQRVSAHAVLVLIDRDSMAGGSLALARQAPRIGMIATDASPAELVDAVRRLARDRPVLDLDLAVAALTVGKNPLTRREREVLRLTSTGATTQEVARNLSLSTGTVRNYLSRILAKTGARTRIEAIRIAQEAGWL